MPPALNKPLPPLEKAGPALDKPLPSPPVAQVVNPMSPVKVSRTLVDAENAGTPTSEQYPAIAPVTTASLAGSGKNG
jgi:hypothetical protein